MNLFNLYATLSLEDDKYRKGLQNAEKDVKHLTSTVDKEFKEVKSSASTSFNGVGNEISSEIEKGADKAKKAIKEIPEQAGKSASELKKEIKAMGSAFKNGLKGIDGALKKVTKGIAGIGSALVANQAIQQEFNRDMAFLETNASQSGNSMKYLQDEMANLNAITGEYDSNLEALSNLMQTGLSDTQMQTALENLKGAVISFPDTLKIEGLADGLQETIATGAGVGTFAELLERTGVNLDVFNEEMAGATTEAERTQIAMNYLANTGMADVNRAFQANNEEIVKNGENNYNLQAQLAELATVMTPLINYFTELAITWIPKLTQMFLENKEVITAVGIAFGALVVAVKGIMIITSLVQGFQAFIAVLPIVKAGMLALNAVMMANPIGLIITAIGALVGAFMYLWNTNEGFRQFWIDAWGAMVEFFSSALSHVITFFTETLPNAFQFVIDFVAQNWPLLIMFIINPFLTTILMLYELNPKFKAWVDNLIQSIKDWFIGLYQAGRDFIMNLWNGAVSSFDTFVSGIKEFAQNAIDTIKSLFSGGSITSIGSNLVKGIWNGISDVTGWIIKKIKGFGDSVINAIKGIFDIHSPSRVMRDLIGKNLALGIGVGFTDNMDGVESDMMKALPTDFDVSQNVKGTIGQGEQQQAPYDQLNELISAISELLAQPQNIIIPTYFGNEKIDEIVVKAKRRVNAKSGGYVNA